MKRFGPPTRLDSILEVLEVEDYLILSPVLLLPWAFGGVEVWAYRTASMLIAAAAGMALTRHGWGGLGLRRSSRWLLPALLLGLWAVVQIVPLPATVIASVSPRADSIYRDTFPGYPEPAPVDLLAEVEARAIDQVPEASGHSMPVRTDRFFGDEVAGRWSGWRTISLLPTAGLERLFWYFSLLLAFLLIRERTRDAERYLYYREFFFGCFAALALFGVVYAATSNGALYWVRETRQETHPMGPYVNPVNFASVMEMAVPWIAGFTLAVARRGGGGWRGLGKTPLFAAGAAVCLISALIAASKASAVLLAVSLTLLIFAAMRKPIARVAVLGVATVLIAGAAWTLSETRLGERVQQLVDTTGGDIESIDRVVILKSSIPLLKDFSVTGSGFGSFREVFGQYLPEGEFLVWEQAHNDYLEALIEGGAIAGALILWLIVAFGFRVLRPRAWLVGGRVDLEYVGLLLGVVSLAVHAFVDFNHQIPGNALLWVAIAALLVAKGERRTADAADSPAPERS